MQLLATPDHEAYFDFCSNLIQLRVYDSAYQAEFRKAIKWEPGAPLSQRQADFRALLKHEATHFLDVTTTAWGRQFTFRKLRFLQLLLAGDPDTSEARAVFALETGELELHSSLECAGDTPPAACDTIQHRLIHTEDFGVCLLVNYLKAGSLAHTVPVSLLSLLEANATASEFLSLLQCADAQDDVVERELSLADVQRRFDNLLNDRTRLEYSALLHVTRVHFADLDLFTLLTLVAGLARFALDLSDMEMSMLADPIENSFSDRFLGDALAMELRRGSHRQLIYFKSILFMYGWMQQMTDAERDTYLDLLRSAPEAAVRRMWLEAFSRDLSEVQFTGDIAADFFEKKIADFGTLGDARLLKESRQFNAQKLRSKSAGLLSFVDMKLLDGFFSDGVEIHFPNRIDIAAAEYFDTHLKTLSRLDAEYRQMSHARFHVPPGTPKFNWV